MNKIRVIFDPVKNRTNKAEHDGISLAEGGSVLEKDPNALTQFDPDHSDGEQMARFDLQRSVFQIKIGSYLFRTRNLKMIRSNAE